MTGAVAERLAELEAAVERGLWTFVEVGEALQEIRDSRLYKERHGTFEIYCDQRWGFTGNYANKQIAAAEVVAALGTSVPRPANEAQARALAPLRKSPKAMAAALEEAGADGVLTAEKVKRAVRRQTRGRPIR